MGKAEQRDRSRAKGAPRVPLARPERQQDPVYPGVEASDMPSVRGGRAPRQPQPQQRAVEPVQAPESYVPQRENFFGALVGGLVRTVRDRGVEGVEEMLFDVAGEVAERAEQVEGWAKTLGAHSDATQGAIFRHGIHPRAVADVAGQRMHAEQAALSDAERAQIEAESSLRAAADAAVDAKGKVHPWRFAKTYLANKATAALAHQIVNTHERVKGSAVEQFTGAPSRQTVEEVVRAARNGDRQPAQRDASQPLTPRDPRVSNGRNTQPREANIVEQTVRVLGLYDHMVGTDEPVADNGGNGVGRSRRKPTSPGFIR